MEDNAIEFRLGELTEAFRSITRELKALREEGRQRENSILARIEQHDQRDDDRFSGVGARLTAIEKQDGILDATTEAEEKLAQRKHDRLNAIRMAVSALIGGLIAALPNLILVFRGTGYAG